MSTSTISHNGKALRAAAGQGGDARTTARRGVPSPRPRDGATRDRLRHGRSDEWRRPAGALSGTGGPGARVSTAGHRPEPSHAASNARVVALAVAVLVLVGGAGYTVRGMGVVDTATTVAVVEVRPGDTLGAIAARNAPGLDVGAVVRQIRSLNNISGTQVRAGQALRVPVTAGR